MSSCLVFIVSSFFLSGSFLWLSSLVLIFLILVHVLHCAISLVCSNCWYRYNFLTLWMYFHISFLSMVGLYTPKITNFLHRIGPSNMCTPWALQAVIFFSSSLSLFGCVRFSPRRVCLWVLKFSMGGQQLP